MESSRCRNKYEFKKKSLRDEALEHLATIDLLELCKEAKVEHCRAPRDVSSCGRYVQDVIKSCGHASLCAECSQRCDQCPICRTPMPKNGSKVRHRLYNECIEAGLISKRYDDRFQEKEDDVQRLYSLFDVAIENNLVSLICHYVTDVCMDESAVSSDPILAFLLDEVVVKDWCKRTFKNIIENLRSIYTLKADMMKMKLGTLSEYISQLAGILCVFDVLESSFKDALSPQLNDLHYLSENILKAKQHLEVMAWCLRHNFLENIQSRCSCSESWRSLVCKRKSFAVERSWPKYSGMSVESCGQDGSTLFIEEALSYLGIDEGYGEGLDSMGIACLEKTGEYPSLFCSKIDYKTGCYPFESVRAATDILFLRGSSDMVVAKQAIFLYYLFDRHRTVPETEWRHLIDDFAASFGIARHSVMESLIFYLLDDETEQALQEACQLLPETACASTHPKIAQVLLERQKPDAALMVLRCSGRDGLCAYANTENGPAQLVSLDEAVTAVRVRVECGLLTEAFMYQRTHCTKVKEEKWKHGSAWALSNDSKDGHTGWMEQMEILVTEICCLCIRRDLVDKMIELPWNSDEEKYLHKCLYETASDDPSTTSGSLLVVFYLQRYRYMEAYQIELKLRSLEEECILKNTNEEVVSKISSRCRWRAQLIDECIKLLPEVLRQRLKAKCFTDSSLPNEVEPPAKADFTEMTRQNTNYLPKTSATLSSVLLGTDPFLPHRKPSVSDTVPKYHSEFNDYEAPSIIHGRLLASIGGSSTPVRVDSPSVNRFTHRIHNRDNFASNSFSSREPRFHSIIRPEFSSDNASISYDNFLHGSRNTPLKELNRNAAGLLQINQHVNPNFSSEKLPSCIEPNGSTNRVENARPSLSRFTAKDNADEMASPGGSFFLKHLNKDSNHAVSGKLTSGSPYNMESPDEAMDFTLSFAREKSGDSTKISALRWRSDDTSEDEEDPIPRRIMSGRRRIRRR